MDSSPVDKPYDALVVGAGPAGSSAAILLAKAGWRVLVVEKAVFPRRKVCGEFISGAAWPLLDELGVGAQVAAGAGPEVRRVGLFADNEVATSTMPANRGRHGRALGREHLDTILMQRARECGAEVREGVDSGEIDPSLAAIVINARGAWSGTAQPSDLLGFKAHFRGARLPADLMPLILFPGGYGGMVTTDAGRVSLSCCVTRAALVRARGVRRGFKAGEALLLHIEETNRGVREALRGAKVDGAWLSAGPIRPATRAFREQGAFAVGNAAGEAHPIIAEGISMAIQSSFLLCERLVAAGRRAPEAALAQVASDYERAWRSNFSSRTRAAAAFAALTTRSPTREVTVGLLPRLPAILTLGARWSGKDRMLRRPALEIR